MGLNCLKTFNTMLNDYLCQKFKPIMNVKFYQSIIFMWARILFK
jgi:hypothetical protein